MYTSVTEQSIQIIVTVLYVPEGMHDNTTSRYYQWRLAYLENVRKRMHTHTKNQSINVYSVTDDHELHTLILKNKKNKK